MKTNLSHFSVDIKREPHIILVRLDKWCKTIIPTTRSLNHHIHTHTLRITDNIDPYQLSRVIGTLCKEFIIILCITSITVCSPMTILVKIWDISNVHLYLPYLGIKKAWGYFGLRFKLKPLLWTIVTATTRLLSTEIRTKI